MNCSCNGVSFQVHFTHRQLCQSGHYGSDSIGSECDPLEATCNVGVHFGWILYWSAVQGRNWQGRGSGYFRIRRLSGLDALPSHLTHHHPHHHFCCPHHHHHHHHGAHQFLFSRSASTLEYGQPVQVWCTSPHRPHNQRLLHVAWMWQTYKCVVLFILSVLESASSSLFFKFFVLFTIYALLRLAALCFCSAVTRPSLICLPPHPSHVLQDLYILSNMRSALFRQRGYTFIQFTPKKCGEKNVIYLYLSSMNCPAICATWNTLWMVRDVFAEVASQAEQAHRPPGCQADDQGGHLATRAGWWPRPASCRKGRPRDTWGERGALSWSTRSPPFCATPPSTMAVSLSVMMDSSMKSLGIDYLT